MNHCSIGLSMGGKKGKQKCNKVVSGTSTRAAAAAEGHLII